EEAENGCGSYIGVITIGPNGIIILHERLPILADRFQFAVPRRQPNFPVAKHLTNERFGLSFRDNGCRLCRFLKVAEFGSLRLKALGEVDGVDAAIVDRDFKNQVELPLLAAFDFDALYDHGSEAWLCDS